MTPDAPEMNDNHKTIRAHWMVGKQRQVIQLIKEFIPTNAPSCAFHIAFVATQFTPQSIGDLTENRLTRLEK